MEPRDADLSLQRTLLLLRRRARWIVLCLILATAIAFGISKLQTKKYTATASLLFNETSQAAEIAGLSGNPSSASQQSIQDTNVLLLQLGGVATKTATQIGHGVTPREVANALSISPLGDTSVVNVSATSTSPTLAADIANTYSTIFVAEQANTNHQTFVSEYNKVEETLAKLSPSAKQSAEGLTLQSRAAALNLVIGLPAGSVQLVSSASPPTSASSPKTKTNTILGAIVGILLGLGVALLLERVDQRIREPKDLEDIYGLPLLGVVPESTALSRAGRDGATAIGLPPREAEVFHLIRAHLRYFEVDRDLRLLLVSSAASGDGKTTVARSLAMAAAQMGSRVLLLEADLRRPTIAHPLGLSAGPGLADVLIGAASLSEATQLVDTDPMARDLSRGRPLSVLVAGATPPPNPGELLESHAMERVLEQSRVAYDLVVIDTAPLTVVSDSFPLLRKVDGVIIVGRVGRERRDVAQRLRQTLASGGGPLLGVIANGVNVRRNPAYGYTYAYDYAAGEGEVVTPTLS